MELRHLRTAIAIGRHGTVNDTAAALGVAPSSISQRTRELENELGEDLFVRTNRGMRPTDRATAFLAKVATALEMIDEAADELHGRPVVARVGALQGIMSGPLQAILDQVALRQPDLDLRVHPEADRTELLRMLQAGDLDVALLLDTGSHPGDLGFPLPAGAFEFVDLREVGLHAVCGAEHALRSGELTPATLRSSGELIGQEERCSYWLATRSWLGPQTSLTAVGGLTQVREWVLAGRGIAVLPEFVVSDDLGSGRLHRLGLDVPPLQLRMVWRTSISADPAQQRLIYALSQI